MTRISLIAQSSFAVFRKFPELRIGLFAKGDHCSSDEECALHLGFGKVAQLNQVHGNIIHIVREPLSPPPNGDGLITDVPDLALSVRFADCQVFAVYAPTHKVIGLIHAGWRGMAANVITAFYDSLKAHFDIAPEETFMAAGPSLCCKCAEFTDPVSELPPHLHSFIAGKNVDLIAAAEAEFDALGVSLNQRERHSSCTKCDPKFWSWRRDKNPVARNYLVVGML